MFGAVCAAGREGWGGIGEGLWEWNGFCFLLSCRAERERDWDFAVIVR